jgi:ubiquinone/menaquinone biosynthesis C-methylase UbiE
METQTIEQKLRTNREFWIAKGSKFLDKEELSIPDKYLNRRENRILRKKICPYSQYRVLDMGCANGFSTIAINRPGTNQVTGIDLNRDFIEFANSLVRKQGYEGIEFRVADMTQLPFEDNYFNIAYAKRSFMNIPSREHQSRALKETARVLKSGGRFFLSDLTEEGLEKVNRIRKKIGFNPLPRAKHLAFLDNDFLSEASAYFELKEEEDHTSGYYFLTKVLNPSTKTAHAPALGAIYSYFPSFGGLGINKLFTFQKK